MTANNERLYFINQIYRDFLFPTILGSDNADILYWAGKKISHQFQLDQLSDLEDFFLNANFGQLTLIKEKKGHFLFSLSGDVVDDRLSAKSTEFSLEAGIIAETLALESEKIVEATYEIDDRKKIVNITALTAKE